MIKTILLILFFFTSLIYAQGNLSLESDTTSTDSTIIVDLGIDANQIQSDYEGGNELRAVGILCQGTWTNDSLQVYAAVHPDSTYYPVYYDNAVVYLIGATGNSWHAFKPTIFAGLRYIKFVMPANEAANRIYWIIRRQY